MTMFDKNNVCPLGQQNEGIPLVCLSCRCAERRTIVAYEDTVDS